MSLQFILGTSGSGKSTYLNQWLVKESIAHPDLNYMILVPEQFTMETQMKITLTHPGHGTMNIDVLSFVRLAHKVFGLVGCEDQVVIDDMGKCVVLEKAALKQAKELPVFGRNLKKAGFITELKSMISELCQYGITPEKLEEAQNAFAGNTLLKGKLSDMVKIYRAFNEELGDTAITAEELLPVMCRYLPGCGIMDGVTIALDGFTGFTPVQYQVIGLFLEYGAKVIVTVTMDPELDCSKEQAAHELFYLSCHTVRKLRELAESVHVAEEAPVLLKSGRRFSESIPLSFLESHFQRSALIRECCSEDCTDQLTVHVCQSPAEEVNLICQQICCLVMEKGLRYKEIAVITGNPEIYNSLFRQKLSELSIPCFVDQKNGLRTHPLAEYICGLQDVILKNFSPESMFRFLKCGLSSALPDEINMLENYVLATGIRGEKLWSELWSKQKRSGEYVDFEEINRIRAQVSGPVLSLAKVWKDKELTVIARQKLLRDYMESEQIEEQLLAYAEVFDGAGLTLQASEYRQAYELLMKLMDEIDRLLGDTVMTAADYLACLESGIEEVKIGSIPLKSDRLIVGDMERTRLSDIKVLFFAGVNEGQVPAASSGGGIFNDYDKEQLLSHSIELSPTSRMAGFMDRFYLYLALTRPMEELHISYTKTDSAGKGLRPSSCIPDLLRMFPSLDIVDASDDAGNTGDIYSMDGMWEYMILQMQDLGEALKNNAFRQVLCYLYEQDRDNTEQIFRAALDGYEPESLPGSLTRALYGQVLSASVSRLEQQAACAFAHFVNYGLNLKERETFSFESSDMGTLFHEALDLYFKRAKENGLDVVNIPADARKALVNACVQDAIQRTGNQILEDTARNRFLAGKLERITDRTVWSLGEQLGITGYETEGTEISFDADDIKAFSVPLTEDWRMALRGRIDRIDYREEDDRLYIRIVDYKSGSKKFDLVSVYYGQQIQLVFYMEAAREMLENQHKNRDVIPGGVLYYNIDDPVIDLEGNMNDADLEKEILKKLQMNGMIDKASCTEEEAAYRSETWKRGGPVELVSEAQFQAVSAHVHELVRNLGREIVSGSIPVNPYQLGKHNACQYCRYRSICGFDQKRKGFRYRNLTTVDKKNVWQYLMPEEEEQDGE